MTDEYGIVAHPNPTNKQQSRPVELESKPVGRSGLSERFLGICFGLLHPESKIEQDERKDDAQAQGCPPDDSQIVRASGDDHRQQSSEGEAEVDLHVCKSDEPAIALTRFDFTRGLGAGHTSGRVFTADANSEQEAVGNESCEQTIGASVVAISTGSQGGKDDEDDGGDDQRLFATPVITREAEEQLAHDCTGKGNASNVRLVGARVLCRVQCLCTQRNHQRGSRRRNSVNRVAAIKAQRQAQDLLETSSAAVSVS